MEPDQMKAMLEGFATTITQAVTDATVANSQEAEQPKSGDTIVNLTTTHDKEKVEDATDTRMTDLQLKIAQAVRGEMKSKAIAAGLIDEALMDLPMFNMPEGTMPGDDSISAKIAEVKEAKASLFSTDQKRRASGQPGTPGFGDDLPDEWDLYGQGIDLRKGLTMEDGKPVFDFGPIHDQAVKKGVDLREFAVGSSGPTGIF